MYRRTCSFRKSFLIAITLLALPMVVFGQGWVGPQLVPSAYLYRTSCTDSNHCWAAGERGIFRTANGGASWSMQFYANGTIAYMYGIDLTDNLNGWASGGSGTVCRTVNGGVNWIPQTTVTQAGLFGLALLNAHNGWIVGDTGTILRIRNDSLILMNNSGTRSILLAVVFTDSNRGWAAGYQGTILHTTNGGATWNRQASGFTGIIYQLSFPDSNHGWAACAGGIILHTTNGGATWTAQTSGTTATLHSIFFSDTLNGWASGSNAIILQTSNGGATWTTQATVGGTDAHDIVFANRHCGWVIGYEGLIYRYSILALPTLTYPPDTSGNITLPVNLRWGAVTNADHYRVQVARDTDFTSVVFDTLTTAVTMRVDSLRYETHYWWRICGVANSIYGAWAIARFFTINPQPPDTVMLTYPANGNQWTSVTPTFVWRAAYGGTRYDIQMSDSSDFRHLIFSQINITNTTYTYVPFLSYGTWYYWRVRGTNAVGAGQWSAIWSFRTLVLDANEPPATTPTTYQLEQNYPNPFNSSTTISFSLPKASEVTLSVFDITGRNITTLARGYRSAGNYRVPFDASALPSGVYVYRLNTCIFKEARKLEIVR